MSVACQLRVARAVATLRELPCVPGRSLDDHQAAALAVIYHSHAENLLAIARRIVATETDAEDVVHDVFTRLPHILRQYQGGGLSAWLRRVTQRTALMQLRKAKRRREQPLVTDAAAGECEPIDSVATDHTDMLHKVLAELAEPLREVIVLRVFLDYTHREIANALDISPTASEVKLSRALKRLRERMRSCGQLRQLPRSA